MAYEIVWTEIASKQFGHLDKTVQKRIIERLEMASEDPFAYSTRLVGFDAYKIRVGDYRVITAIEKKILTILVLKVGHRKSIYK